MGKLERTNVVKVAPTISTGIYTALDIIGGVQTLTNAMGVNGGAGVLHNLTVIDDDNEKAELTIVLFDSEPGGTVGDNGAWVPAAGDAEKILGHFTVFASDYVTIVTGSLAVATFRNLGLPVRASASSPNLYAIAFVGATPTYTAVTDLRLVYGFLLD